MNYKIKHSIKKSKTVLIVAAVVWFALTIFFIAPLSVSTVDATTDGVFNFGICVTNMIANIGNIGGNLSTALSSGYIGTFLKIDMYFTIAVLLFTVVGFTKAMPKHEYADIEHGSSDWSEKGEQYSLLSKNKGILLAEKNFLPVNKRGNINVMVVGRFWFW